MIEFTQYKLPHGRKVPVYINRSGDIEAKATVIADYGYRFECEILSTGLISLTITGPSLHEGDDGEEMDVAIRVCKNNEEVPLNVDLLINRFFEELSRKHGI